MGLNTRRVPRRRLDDNHAAIVEGLRANGCSVQSLASIGKGCPDVLWAKDGKAGVIEIKNPAQPPSKRRLTEDEDAWRKNWRGEYMVAETLADALYAVQRALQRA